MEFEIDDLEFDELEFEMNESLEEAETKIEPIAPTPAIEKEVTQNDSNVIESTETTTDGNPRRNGLLLGPSLPKQDEAYIEREFICVDGQSPVPFEYQVPAKPTHEHELEMWHIINHFESDAWSAKSVGLKTGWEQFDKAFDGGIKPGFIVIGGDSNLGKSAVMSQLAWQIVENEPNAYVMDFSLDDPMPDKLSRIISSGSKVLLNAVKNPQGYQDMPIMLGRRKLALNRLRERVDRYHAYDASFSTYIEDIEEEIQRKMIALDSAGIEKQIVVFIDNLYDLNIKSGAGGMDQRIKYDIIAQWCADTAIRYNIPIICTAELRKINGAKRPELDDIRDCTKVKYEAKAVIMVYNEVHYKGDAADVYFTRSNNPLKQPVLELHFAKNKMSSYKGRLFFEFYPEMARLEQPDEQAVKHYASFASA